MARKVSSHKAPTPKPKASRKVSLREFFADAIAKPPGFTALSVVEELTAANDWRIIELITLYDYMQQSGAIRPTPEIIEQMFGRQRYRGAVQSLYDQLLEQQLNVQQLQRGRGRPPGKGTLVGSDINRALKNIGLNEAKRRQFWKEFETIRAAPADPPSTIRKRVSQASHRKA
jgi:hypothetical protein